MLRPTVPLTRLPYLGLGVGLFAVKIALDFLVARVFHRPYSLLFYVSPMDAPLFRRGEAPEYWAALWGVAIPFIFVGVILTLRRLRDASLSPWLVLLFFIPFANLLFFAVAAAAPSHRTDEGERAVAFPRMVYRASSYQATPPPHARPYGASIAMAALLGVVIALGAVGISVGVMRSYGAGLMLGAPIFSGFATSMFYVKLRPDDGYAGAALATFLSFLISFAVTIGFALEGLGCLVMFIPLVVPVTFFGSFMGFIIAKSLSGGSRRLGPTTTASLLVLPAVFGAEKANPLPEAPAEAVESEVVVDAPPDVVWKRVIAFPPLAPPNELMFRHGIAAPMRATIDGEGPGAIRRCVFTTGTFVEPIEVWRPGRELTFSVTAQPDPMVEQTLWNSVRPPHLDGYLQTTRGQFVLEPMPGNKTRLVGRTWYRTHMTPEPYWRAWADPIIHRIHLRVLDHVKRLSEDDVRSSEEAGRAQPVRAAGEAD